MYYMERGRPSRLWTTLNWHAYAVPTDIGYNGFRIYEAYAKQGLWARAPNSANRLIGNWMVRQPIQKLRAYVREAELETRQEVAGATLDSR